MAEQKQEWQPQDLAFKEQVRSYGPALLDLLGVGGGPLEIERVDSISLRIAERRLDAVFEVRQGTEKRVIAVECETELRPTMPNRVLILLSVLRTRYPGRRIDVYVLAFSASGEIVSGIEMAGEDTALRLSYKTLPLWEESATQHVKTSPPEILVFTGLMAGASKDLLERAQERIFEEAGRDERNDLLKRLWMFAGLRFKEEVIMAIQHKLREQSSYLTLVAEDEARSEARGEARGRRDQLADQVARKFPKQKRAAIAGRLAAIEDPGFLHELSLRVLDTLTWREFWRPLERDPKVKPTPKRSRRQG